MADAGNYTAQGNAHVTLCLRSRFFYRMQIFPPCHQIAATAEIGAYKCFGIYHARCCTFFQHRHRQTMIILRRFQGFGGGFIDLQELPEIGEGIVAVSIKNPGDIHVLFTRKPANKGGWGSTFQMQVQLNFRQRDQSHKKLFPVPWARTPRCAATDAAISVKAQSPSAPDPAPATRTGTRSRV